MSSISILGLGTMARAIGRRAVEAGHAVEVIGRDPAKAVDLARVLGGGATTETFDAVPAGDIVLLAVPYESAVPIVARYGDALAGKVIVDMTNPFNSDLTGLVTPDGVSAAQEIAKAAPADASVVKAFNTTFGHVLIQDYPLDVLLSGDDQWAKTRVSSFIQSLGLQPLDIGPLEMANHLEATGLVMLGVARFGVKHYNFALEIKPLG